MASHALAFVVAVNFRTIQRTLQSPGPLAASSGAPRQLYKSHSSHSSHCPAPPAPELFGRSWKPTEGLGRCLKVQKTGRSLEMQISLGKQSLGMLARLDHPLYMQIYFYLLKCSPDRNHPTRNLNPNPTPQKPTPNLCACATLRLCVDFDWFIQRLAQDCGGVYNPFLTVVRCERDENEPENAGGRASRRQRLATPSVGKA